MRFLPSAAVLLCLVCEPAWGTDACQLSLSPASVNYGVATRVELVQRVAGDDKGAGFGLRSVHLRVQCPDVRLIRWAFVAPQADAQRYRWAAGTLQLRVVAARLDGTAVQWRLDGGQPLDGGLLRPGAYLVAWQAGGAAFGSVLEVEVELDARVDDASSRPANLLRFEGHGSFQVD